MNTMALHIHRKTKVYSCFLDDSKAFDRVSHNTLFSILEKRDVSYCAFFGLGAKTSLALLNGTPTYQTPLVVYVTGLIYGLSEWAAPALFYSQYWLSWSSLCWLLMLCWSSRSIILSSQNSSQRMWTLCHWSQAYFHFCQNSVNHNLRFNALANFSSQVTLNSLTLLLTLVMFYIVLLTTVITSIEPHLKCVILS